MSSIINLLFSSFFKTKNFKMYYLIYKNYFSILNNITLFCLEILNILIMNTINK